MEKWEVRADKREAASVGLGVAVSEGQRRTAEREEAEAEKGAAERTRRGVGLCGNRLRASVARMKAAASRTRRVFIQ